MTDPVRFAIETDREVDGRWIAEVVDIPGVMVYGTTEDDAIRRAEVLAAEVLADQAEHREDGGLAERG
ncbi:MAG TPA: hypothetical protein VK399_19135 [Longimicrobiaceae bacterium]|jgi:predicted RNase H-like HicB family nuclease|nr:hypothetical protein [Longimicrobiaceae bacterium]